MHTYYRQSHYSYYVTLYNHSAYPYPTVFKLPSHMFTYTIYAVNNACIYIYIYIYIYNLLFCVILSYNHQLAEWTLVDSYVCSYLYSVVTKFHCYPFCQLHFHIHHLSHCVLRQCFLLLLLNPALAQRMASDQTLLHMVSSLRLHEVGYSW